MNLDHDDCAFINTMTDSAQSRGPQQLLPYRTKTSAELRSRVLETAKAEILRRMRELIVEFKTSFREPPAYMVLHRISPGQHIYVRWRMYGRKSSFITPSSASAPDFFRQLEPHTRTVIADFWRRSLDLNLAFALRHLEWTRLRQYIEDVDALNNISRTRASR